MIDPGERLQEGDRESDLKQLFRSEGHTIRFIGNFPKEALCGGICD